MKTMFRVALMLGLVATTSTVSLDASQPTGPDELTTDVYVMNNHLVTVRVFAEDAEGKLHRLGRVARGTLKTFTVPQELAAEDFRIKVFPTSSAWSPISDDYGVKTNPLSVERDRQVMMWLERDLAKSLVEIHRG